MDTDEGPLINENSNGLSHLLTETEFNSVDAVIVDESSASNQGFLNAVELSAGSVGDYLENNTDGFDANSFDVGDNAVNFQSDSLNNVLSDSDSRLSNSFKPITDGEVKMNDFEPEVSEMSSEVAFLPEDSQPGKTDDDSRADVTTNDNEEHEDTAVTDNDTSTKDISEVHKAFVFQLSIFKLIFIYHAFCRQYYSSQKIAKLSEIYLRS